MWRVSFRSLFLAAGVLGLEVSVAFAQHTYTQGEIDDGGRLYRANCTTCHGPEGDAVNGVDLGHGQFRRASSDDDLIRIIRTGIPGTAMPPNNFSEQQAGTIVAYLRSLAATTGRDTSIPGDATRGKAIFEGKGDCASCHRVKGNGSRLGPDLSDIGQFRRSVELERSLVDPGAEVLPVNRSYRVVTKDGATITGRLLNQDSFTVQLLDSKERLVSYIKSNLREYGFIQNSPMPSYRDKLSSQELADVVSYLVSLKGQNNP
jgi:putative heme-binding domain-containing protein